MSFNIDGSTWTPKTAQEHCDLIIEKINELLQENNIQDKNGNIAQIKKTYGNALYLLTLGDGEQFADNDAALSQAINSFNIELCDDQQIENLLPIAAITRNQGSYSTLRLTVKASEDGECIIPVGTKAPYENTNFVTQVEAIIPAGHTQIIETVADEIGPIVVLSGEVTSFDTEIANLESVINDESSVPGNAAETTNSLRQRILKGNTIPYSLDGVKLALEELTGINHARVYFNYNVDGGYTFPGNIVIDPRTAYIVISGGSDKLAETYARYMSAPTQNAPNASPTGTYTTIEVDVTAGENGAVVPSGTSFEYDGMRFTTDTDTEITANSTETITFTANDVGAIIVPADTITEFDSIISGVTLIENAASVPGLPKSAYTQNYTTASGQTIPIKYDTAVEQTVFVKIFYTPNSESETGDEVRNQLKKDLIKSSASWQIGENVTSLLTSVPFDGCIYTTVAYTQVSTDGTTWGNIIQVAANAIPRVSDDTISTEPILQ